jgi:hypothetical protein
MKYLQEFPKEIHNDWKAKEKDFKIIKQRIQEKLILKPE